MKGKPESAKKFHTVINRLQDQQKYVSTDYITFLSMVRMGLLKNFIEYKNKADFNKIGEMGDKNYPFNIGAI